MIMMVKTPGSHIGSPAAAEEGGEAMEGGRGESGPESCKNYVDTKAEGGANTEGGASR